MAARQSVYTAQFRKSSSSTAQFDIGDIVIPNVDGVSYATSAVYVNYVVSGAVSGGGGVCAAECVATGSWASSTLTMGSLSLIVQLGGAIYTNLAVTVAGGNAPRFLITPGQNTLTNWLLVVRLHLFDSV